MFSCPLSTFMYVSSQGACRQTTVGSRSIMMQNRLQHHEVGSICLWRELSISIDRRYHPISVLVRHNRPREKDTPPAQAVWSYSDTARAIFLVALRTFATIWVLQERTEIHQDPCMEHEVAFILHRLPRNRLALMILGVHLYCNESGQTPERETMIWQAHLSYE